MRIILFIAAILFGVIALAACGSQSAATTAMKIDIAGGSYTNVAPAQLK